MKTYIGRRFKNVVDVKINDGGEIRRLKHIVRHSPDGFNWGYGGSGPADLAFAILRDCVGEDLAEKCYYDFKWEVVAGWKDYWQITEVEVNHWLIRKGAIK